MDAFAYKSRLQHPAIARHRHHADQDDERHAPETGELDMEIGQVGLADGVDWDAVVGGRAVVVVGHELGGE